MRVVDWNPAEGLAFQGDVSIIPIPADIAIAHNNEIAPADGKLILQEGELTGHHHHIDLHPRNFKPAREVGDAVLHVRDTKLRKAFAGGKGKNKTVSARLYRDPAVAAEMQRRGILARSDLAVGCLVIEGEAFTVTHQEHDAIRLPVGNYLIGRQIESAGAEERHVVD